MSMDTKRIVTASINGAEISVMADNRMSLLETLRAAAALRGT